MADNLSILDDQHRTVFETALNRILASELAETTFAEILDGLPTQTTWFETHSREPADHPVFALEHHSLCPGILEKVKGFRQTFDPAQLTFSITVLEHFQQATPDTKQFKLRLIELLAVACHQIAVYLWNLYDGPHKHSDYEKWRDEAQDRPLHDPSNWYRPYIAPTPFYHRRYIDFDQYPNDIADIVGYWAEARIFGGVVVFNRGESGNEVVVHLMLTYSQFKELYLHGHQHNGPNTLYPPTNQQYTALVDFLLGPGQNQDPASALPIHATDKNRWRYSAEDAMVKYNIFRDRYERKPPTLNPNEGDRTYHPRHYAVDWPELVDEQTVINSFRDRNEGKEVDVAEVEGAIMRLRTTITPSSPLWHSWGTWKPESEAWYENGGRD